MAEELHNLIVEPLATAGPAARARELFDAAPQAREADDLRRERPLTSKALNSDANANPSAELM